MCTYMTFFYFENPGVIPEGYKLGLAKNNNHLVKLKLIVKNQIE